MAEYIEREAFKAEICRLSTHYLNEWDTLVVLAAADRIPAADVRPVVLCKDCKYWELSKINQSFHVCTYLCGVTFVRKAYDFCSRGEKLKQEANK